jgi:hypothetical protein
MLKLRDYQVDIARKACDIMRFKNFVYLSMSVRTGKTLTSLEASRLYGAKSVLFVTKKKAIDSVEDDFKKLDPNFSLFVINWQSMHKIPDTNFDVVILDEAHCMGSFPKPSLNSKNAKDLVKKMNPKFILLSGTPTPESYSQMFHQVNYIPGNPFQGYVNFYKFAKDYVDVRKKKIGGYDINDYSKGLDVIIQKMSPFTISYTQEQAGFVSEINEHVEYVDIKPSTISLINRLKKDFVVEGKEEVILADTAVKLQSKIHQLYSGTVKFESGNSAVLDYSKAEYIFNRFSGKKIAIFYKFQEEYNALKTVFNGLLTNDVGKFKNYENPVIALQIVSGREGINLSEADFLVYYNIDFSATSYWQSRDRMTTIDRKSSDVYWIFSRGGIEEKIYKSVSKKKSYTLRHFKNDFNIK